MPFSLGYSKSARQIWKMTQAAPSMLRWTHRTRTKLMEWVRSLVLKVPQGWKRTAAWVLLGSLSAGVIGMLYTLVFMAVAWVYVLAVGLIVGAWMMLTVGYMTLVMLVVALLQRPRAYRRVPQQW
jgi:sterol desaturase/sphingolipid hydroxylase (fatty acid hydroxylase superfamily)